MATVYSRKLKDGSRSWYTKEPGPDGEWKPRLLKGVKNKTEARRLAEELESNRERLEAGLEAGARFRGTVADLADWAWKVHFKGLRSNQSDLNRIKNHFAADTELGRLSVEKVTSDRINQYLNDYAEKPTVRGGPPAASTVNRIRAMLSSMFTVAIEHKKWPKGANPVEDSKKRDVVEMSREALKPHEIWPVIEHTAHYWRGCVAVGLLAGLRKGEILALRKSDIDIERGIITVQRSNEHDGTKGTSHPESVPIHPDLMPFVEEWMRSPGPLLFPNRAGKQRSAKSHVERLVQTAMRRAGICEAWDHKCRRKGCGHAARHPDATPRACPACGYALWPVGIVRPVTFHGTRHTWATHALRSGIPMQHVQKVLRHKDPRLTIRTYGHLDVGDLAAQMGRFVVPKSTAAAPRAPLPTVASPCEHPAPECKVESPAPARHGAYVVRGESGSAGVEPGAFRSGVKLGGLNRGAEGDRTPDLCIANGPRLRRSSEQASQVVGNARADEAPESTPLPAVAPRLDGRGAPMVRGGGGPGTTERSATPVGPWLGSATACNDDPEAAGVLLTVREVAARLSVSPDWVYRRIAAGELGHVRFGGNAIRVPVEALEAYLRTFPGLGAPRVPARAESAPVRARRAR